MKIEYREGLLFTEVAVLYNGTKNVLIILSLIQEQAIL